MKELLSKKTLLTGLLSAALITAVCLAVFGGGASRLSEKQIAALRTQCPVILYDDMPGDIVKVDLNTKISISPFVAEIEVLEQMPDYVREFTDVLGFLSKITFCQFKIRVCEILINNQEISLEDDVLYLCYNKGYESSYPTLYPGLRAIASLAPREGSHQGEYRLPNTTFFYITENDYVLSAFEEFKGENYSGMTKDNFISEIKKMAISSAGIVGSGDNTGNIDSVDNIGNY